MGGFRMKQEKDAASPEHRLAKDILSRMIEDELGWTAEQEVEAPYDAGRRRLRLDVVAIPPRRAKPWPKFAFEIQSANLEGKRAEIRDALENGLRGYADIILIPIGGLTEDLPVAKWRRYLRSYMQLMERVPK